VIPVSAVDRGITRLDGAPKFEPEGLSKANMLLKKEALATLLGLFGAPRSDSVPP